jgi:hypothetical protein
MAAQKRFVRKRLLVDPKVQRALILRVVLYWIVCLVTVTLMLLCWRIATHPEWPLSAHFDDMWLQFGPALLTSLVLLPLVILDILRVSNRFTGPLFRLRHAMRALARGEQIRPINFREGDFWIEVAHEFNAILARFEFPAAQPADAKEEQEPVEATTES